MPRCENCTQQLSTPRMQSCRTRPDPLSVHVHIQTSWCVVIVELVLIQTREWRTGCIWANVRSSVVPRAPVHEREREFRRACPILTPQVYCKFKYATVYVLLDFVIEIRLHLYLEYRFDCDIPMLASYLLHTCNRLFSVSKVVSIVFFITCN